MTWTAFFLVVASATFHASWNLLAKKHRITVPFLFIIGVVSVLLTCNVFFWTPVNYSSLPLRFWAGMLSALMGDTLYWIGLMTSYRLMDMSSAYPMMRSLPILLTTAATWLLGAGERLSPVAICGIVLIFFGCMSMPLKSYRELNWRTYCGKSMFFILVTAAGTTVYTIMDSQAQRILREFLTEEGFSRPVLSLSYYAARAVLLTIGIGCVTFASAKHREEFRVLLKNDLLAPVFAGTFATAAYALVLLAMNYVDNVTYVQVFRQLGLLIGMAGAMIFLKEKATVPKIAGGLMIVTGLILSVLK